MSTNSTNTAQVFSEPLKKRDRILFLDCIRGFALLGILLMNSMAQSQSHHYYERMDLSQPVSGPNFYAWAAETFFFEGTMRGLFSILFGAGTLLLLNRLVKTHDGLEPADIYYRRMLWLLFFGLLNAFVFLWPGDILYPYAICGLLLFPFRNLKPAMLIYIAIAFLAIGTYRENTDLYDAKSTIEKGLVVEALAAKKVKLTDEQKADLEKYNGFKDKNTTAGIAKAAQEETLKIKGQSYASIFTYYRDINMMIESVMFYNSYIWDIMVCLFLGMALFKSGFLTGEKPIWLYSLIAVVGISIGLTLNYFYLKTQYQLRFDQFAFTKVWDFNYYSIRRVFQTVGYLSSLILLYKIAPVRKAMNVMVPVGQMAFTNYLAQSIITSTIFYGFGLFATLQRYEVYFVVAAIWVFQIIFSHIWLYFFRFGPFEWLWRSLTYLRRQPMLRERPVEIGEPVPVVIT